MLQIFNFLKEAILFLFKFSLVITGGVALGRFLAKRRVEHWLPGWALTSFSVVILGVSFYFVYSFFSFRTFHYPARDLGEYTQVVWNLSLGRGPQSTIKPTPNYFGLYFQPILILISFVFRFWPSPLFLLILQAVIVCLGGFPIYWLAMSKLKSKLAAWAIAASYLCFFGIQNALAFGFYPVSLASAFLAFAFYFAEISAWKFLFPMIVLLLLCQENVSLYVLFLAFYLLVFRRERIGFLLGTLALFWYFGVVFVVMPKISGHPYPHFVFEPPWRFFWPPAKLKTMLILFGSVGFLIFFAWDKMLLALPMLIEQFLINRPSHWTTAFHYDIAIAPPLFWAVISTLEKWPKQRSWLVFSLLGWSFFQTIFFGLPLSHLFRPSFYQKGTREKDLTEMVFLIPSKVSVSATDSLVPHLANRAEIFHFVSAEEELKRKPEFIVLGGETDAWPLAVDAYQQEIMKLLGSGDYEKVFQSGNRFVLRRLGSIGD